jgi:WD40 repeat protein
MALTLLLGAVCAVRGVSDERKVEGATTFLNYYKVRHGAEREAQLACPTRRKGDIMRSLRSGGLIVSLGTLFWLSASTCPLTAQPTERLRLYVQKGHSSSITKVRYLPDGGHAITSSLDGTLRLWDVNAGREIRAFVGHWAFVDNFDISKDGDVVVSCSGDGTVRVWDIHSGKELRRMHWLLNAIAISPDKKRVVGGGPAGGIVIIDFDSGDSIRYIRRAHSDRITALAYSRDGRLVVSGSTDTLQIWDAITWNKLGVIKGLKGPISSLVLTPDGSNVITAGLKGSVEMWDITTHSLVRTFTDSLGYLGSPNGVTISPDGRMAAWCEQGQIGVYNVSTGRLVRRIDQNTHGAWTALAFSPDAKYLLSGGVERPILKVWNVSDGVAVNAFPLSLAEAVTPLGFAELLLKASNSPLRSVRNLGTSNLDFHFCSSLPDGSLQKAIIALPGRAGNSIGIRNLQTDEFLAEVPVDSSDELRGYALSPDGKRLCMEYRSGYVEVWNVATRTKVHKLLAHPSTIRAAAFSSDGRYLVTASTLEGIRFRNEEWQNLKLWDVDSGDQIWGIETNEEITVVAISNDMRYVLTGNKMGELRLREAQWGQAIHSVKNNLTGDNALTSKITFAVFHPDGRSFFCGNQDGAVQQYSVQTGRQVHAFIGHSEEVDFGGVSLTGELLVTGSQDRTIRLWNIYTGDEIASLVLVDSADWVVASPDGRFDGSPGGMKALHYVQGMDVLPLESFFDRFFTPGLLAKVISGTLPRLRGDQIDFSKPIKLPPLLKILSPQTGDIFHTNQIQLKVDVTDQGGGIDEIRVSQNNKVIKVETKEAQPLPATRIYPIKLVADENTIQVTAFNNDRTESIPAVIVINLEATQPISDMYIVAVGINNYARDQLHYAKADADAFVQAIEQKGKGLFKTIRKTILCNEDAVKEKILPALKDVAERASDEDVFVFYYSGHGVMSEPTDSASGDFFLVLQDIEKQYGANDILRDRGISAKMLKELCFKIKAQKQLIVIDACYSGGLIESFALKGASEEKAIYELARNTGVFVLAASNKEQPAKEIPSVGHGVFTYALLEGLNCHPEVIASNGRV